MIGGGIAGLSAALALQERGSSVVLLERRGVLGGRASASLDARTGDEVESGGHRLHQSATATRDLLRRSEVGSLADLVSTTPRWSRVHDQLGDRFVSLGGSLRRRALAVSCVVEAGRVRRVRYIQRAATRLEIQRGKREVQQAIEVDIVIAAVPWHALGALVPQEWRSERPFAEVGRLKSLATVTIHLWIDGAATALTPAASRFACLLDRTRDDGTQRLRHYSLQTGALAAIPGDSNADWVKAARQALSASGGPRGNLDHALVLREPFALAAAHASRLGPKSSIEGLYICGDWTHDATLDAGIEAAVRSGLSAADAISASGLE